MRLGLDSYSLRWQGWDAFQFLDYTANLGLDNVQFSSRDNLGSLEEGYLRTLRDYAAARGLTLELGIGSIDRHAASFRPDRGSGEEQLSEMIRAAAIVGSPVVRCFLGSQDERAGMVPLAEHIAECVRVLRGVAPLAREHGVMIAVENHGGVDLLARELLALVERAGPETVGVCLDTGNPPYGGEDPHLAVELLAPYTVTTHLRDTRVWATREGALAQWVPLGAGNLDLPRVLATLGERAATIPLNLEVITGVAPAAVPFLAPDGDFWSRYPDMLARDFARYLALAQRGTAAPFEQLTLPRGVGMLPAEQPPAHQHPQKAQQPQVRADWQGRDQGAEECHHARDRVRHQGILRRACVAASGLEQDGPRRTSPAPPSCASVTCAVVWNPRGATIPVRSGPRRRLRLSDNENILRPGRRACGITCAGRPAVP